MSGKVISPVIKYGYLKRFKKGFLSKGFKYVYVELLSDSHLLWYRDQTSSKPDGYVFLKDVCNFLAVGPYTRAISCRPSLPRGASERHILAVPLTACVETPIQWFLFCSDPDLNDWMVKINSTLPPLPPPSTSPDDTTLPDNPPPPYDDEADHCNCCESNCSTQKPHSSHNLFDRRAVTTAAGVSLWGWTWGWGGGWGCEGWACFDYGPSSDASVALSNYDTGCHDFGNGASDPQFGDGSGFDMNGCEIYDSGGADLGGFDTAGFDACDMGLGVADVGGFDFGF